MKIEKTRIDLSKVEAGPIRHQWLDADLVARIAAVRQALIDDEDLADLACASLSVWVDDFRRDAHPEIEVAGWERAVSTCRSHRLQHPTLSREEKRKVLGRALLSAELGRSE